jgi:hypothetical protein
MAGRVLPPAGAQRLAGLAKIYPQVMLLSVGASDWDDHHDGLLLADTEGYSLLRTDQNEGSN